jgi:acyl transferase domain-containing protein/NADPH:quinone reductase-like Zn-dependent oxidoreductase/NADP-dependent 3-hydroxy acid dehydrogenase YdfG/acyl carrier protein
MPVKEPIAIVGMACRFPGGADDPSSFWELLCNGVDAITEVPPERWNAARFHHPNSAAPGRMVARWGGFVANATAFDAAFFGIAPREAARLDPQHRWLMEVTWEAMEDAGLQPEQLSGTKTGVFVGISTHDYIALLRQQIHLVDGYVNIGSALCIAANRLSFLFNFRGPSFAVDTACSSSLVALHLAAQSLRSGECDYAVVAAANELLSPQSSIGFSQAHMLSPNGRSRAFDADADGYVRSEGAGAVLLMPLRKAESLGLQPRALLLATASNQDGRSSSLTVPNQQAQEEMLREALQHAGASARDIVYVETHGTGTPVGDPIEARAVAAVLADGRQPNERLIIGSVKTNIGHLESASGIAGLIKTVLVLEQRAVPPNLHFVTPNPQVPMERVQIPTALTPLPSNNGSVPLVAVNSFGFGGSNAHALLAPAPASDAIGNGSNDGEPHIFPLSARSSAALAEYAKAYARLISDDAPPNLSLGELCAASALGKSHHALRAAVVADSLATLQSRLLALPASEPAAARPKIAFVFSGQGPQWWAMGRQLYHREKIVREAWKQCDDICRKLGGPSVLDALLATETNSLLSRTDIAQPALFALQAGLVELWRAWGIKADMMIGHSVGEAAAAWAAGIFDLEGIFRVVIARSRWHAKMHGLGRMLASALSADEARAWERKFAGRVSVAAFNAPQQVTLSGDAAALEEIAAALKEAEVFCRFLPTHYAFHSAQMDVIEEGLRQELSSVAGGAAKVPMISTVTGELVQGPELNADYWWQNVRQPVRFAAGIEHLLREGCTAFVEIGPHPVMASALAEIALAQKSTALRIASLRRDENERRTMLLGLASLYRMGAAVRWEGLYRRPARALRLPAYPWQRQRLWHESADAARAFRSAPPHPLLGDRQPDPQPTWINHLDARLIPWLADHRIAGSAVLPAAAYIEMAAAAVREFLDEPTIFLEEIRFHHLLFLPEEQPVPTCVRLDPAAGSFEIFAAPPETPSDWKVHAEGIFRPGRLHIPPTTDLELLGEPLTEECDPKAIYKAWSEIGQVFGPAFQGLTSLRRRENEALATISSPAERGSANYLLFPPLLDSSFHSSAAIERERQNSRGVVASVRQVRIFQALPQKAWSHARVAKRDEHTYLADIALLDQDGGVLAQLDGLAVRAIDSASAGRGRKSYEMVWEPAAAAVEEDHAQAAAEVLIFADGEGLGVQLAESLRTRKIPAILVFADAKRSECNGSAMAVDVREDDWASRLWKTLAARGPLPARIIYLWGCDEARANARICSAFLSLTQARLANEGSDDPARWLIVTRRAQLVNEGESITPAPGALWGFVRTVQSEHPQWHMSLVDCGEGPSPDPLLREFFAAEIEPEVGLRGDDRLVRRLRQFQPKSSQLVSNAPAYALEIGQSGRTDSLEFHGTSRGTPGPGEVEIEIAAAALNFRDLMKVLGIYPLRDGEPANLGDECSGRVLRVGRGVRKVKPGDRVMVALLEGGAFASHLITSVDNVWKIPDTLGFPEAASIPVVFGTAYHALINLARLRRGETVLIHAAAGGVGLAAVQLAQQIGAVVLATAGNDEKREYLRSLGVKHVMDSRTLDFAEETLRFTEGRGVDVVLNSLAGAFQQKTLAICAANGRFIEIGKRDLFENKGLPLAAFQRSLSFSAFDLLAVRTGPAEQKRAVERFFAEGFTRGKLKPIRCTTFPARDPIPAFRMMQSAQHIGKIVLEFDRTDPPEVPAEFWPDPDGTYLITGGLAGFGLATARWLAGRGAMHLALVSRRGQPLPEDAPIIAEMRDQGISVLTVAADVANAKALGAVLRGLKKSTAPLRGLFHAAMVLRDRPLTEMTQQDLAAVLRPKMTGAWNLHTQTRDMPLDCFVMFSSLSSLIGSPGQANYAAANAYLDALAHHRRAQGLHGLSVNWGQISDVGVVAERPEVGCYLENIGVRGLSSKEALATLPRLIASGPAQAGVMNVNWEKLALASSKFGVSPVFRDLVQAGKANSVQDQAANAWRESVLRLSPEQQMTAVSDLVVAQLATTFGMAPAEVDRTRPLAQLGMDSLMAVELKARIESHAGCELPISIFNVDLTAERLAERFAGQISKSAPVVKPTVAARSASTADEITVPLLRTESRPLVELVRGGKLAPLTAAALMPWPGIVLEYLNLSPEAFFQLMSGGRVSLDLILETPLGSVGIVMLPLTTDQVNPGEPSLLPHLLEGVAQASACGARCVALTGLIPSATNYGATVQAERDNKRDLAAVTTGHATTIAAVIVNLEALLSEAGRDLSAETVMFYGIGSIGLSALQLMLDVLPHPADLRLCDPYRSEEFFDDLKKTLRQEQGYQGDVRVVRSGSENAEEFYDASVIVGATNVENVIDVARLAPGTLIVDDSWPHCMNGPAALARFNDRKDILITEGGFVRSREPMPRIAHVPPSIAASLPAELPQLLFSSLNPHDITACILSALISVRRPELVPTVGLITPAAARRHWQALTEIGFSAAELSYEGESLSRAGIDAFRHRFGKSVAGSRPVVATV